MVVGVGRRGKIQRCCVLNGLCLSCSIDLLDIEKAELGAMTTAARTLKAATAKVRGDFGIGLAFY